MINNKKKVAVLMSGGVDSSVACLLLQEKGYEIIGITGKFIPCDIVTHSQSCCNTDSLMLAKEFSKKYNFEHHTFDLTGLFKEKVIDNFHKEYISGKTPNPCIRCNEEVKIKALYEKAKKLGADAFATGHYAKLEFCRETNRYNFIADFGYQKDQTYFLFSLPQAILKDFILPLAGITKDEVKTYAKSNNLIAASRKESQEICFVENNNYKDFLIKYYDIKTQNGLIVDKTGKKLGTHSGYFNYTIGQRKGLNIGGLSKPLYVTGINAKSNEVIVGNEEELFSDHFFLYNITYQKLDSLPESNYEMFVKIRSTAKPVIANVYKTDQICKVVLKEKTKAITPGQAAVFYNDKGELLFGGWISTKLEP